jgi:hypothetical protein
MYTHFTHTHAHALTHGMCVCVYMYAYVRMRTHTHIRIYMKGKVLPIPGQEGPEGEQRYSSTLSLTSAQDEGG